AHRHRRHARAAGATMVTVGYGAVAMRNLGALVAAIVVGGASLAPVAPPASGATRGLPLERVRHVRLPASASRFDYQDVDPARNRLFIAHLGANQVEAIDLATLQVGGVVRDVPKVHGVRVASDLGAVYASATSSDMVVAIDAS